jgi:hypothetical protein
LGYGFASATNEVGKRMHVTGIEYKKMRLAPLYGRGGVIGKNKNLHPLYNILLQMFRENIAPKREI